VFIRQRNRGAKLVWTYCISLAHFVGLGPQDEKDRCLYCQDTHKYLDNSGLSSFCPHGWHGAVVGWNSMWSSWPNVDLSTPAYTHPVVQGRNVAPNNCKLVARPFIRYETFRGEKLDGSSLSRCEVRLDARGQINFKFFFSCLTLAWMEVCAKCFAIKAFGYRNGFHVVDWEGLKLCTCVHFVSVLRGMPPENVDIERAVRFGVLHHSWAKE